MRLNKTRFGAAIAVALIALAALFFFHWRAGFGAIAILAGLGLFTYAKNAARRQERLAGEPDALRGLKADFSRWRLTPALSAQAERALEQLAAGKQEHERFMKMLGEKLSPRELTYARWSAAADDFGRAFWRGFEDLREAMSRGALPEIETRLRANDDGLMKLRDARGALALISSAPAEADYAAALLELETVAARAKRLAASQRSPDAE